MIGFTIQCVFTMLPSLLLLLFLFFLPQILSSTSFRGLFRAKLGVVFLPHLIINRYAQAHTHTRAREHVRIHLRSPMFLEFFNLGFG